MPKQPHPREAHEHEDDPSDDEDDPEVSPTLFDNESDDADASDGLEGSVDDDDIEQEEIVLDDLAAMEGPDA